MNRLEGAPIVLSHGLGDDAATWSELRPLLEATHRVVTWDLRGHGVNAASAQAADYSPGAASADLLAVVRATGGRVHLAGHSLGGYLSLAVALSHPQLVESLTLIGSGPGYRDPAARQAWNREVDRAVLRMPVPPAAAALAHQHDSWVMDHVAELQPPLLVIVGERDERFHAGAAYLGRAVHGSTVRDIAGAGHHPQRTHPEEVATALLDHIARSTTAATEDVPR